MIETEETHPSAETMLAVIRKEYEELKENLPNLNEKKLYYFESLVILVGDMEDFKKINERRNEITERGKNNAMLL